MHRSFRTAFIVAGLPESPVRALQLSNITVARFPGGKGWDCERFKACDWNGGGCALGEARNVKPPPPANCLRGAEPSAEELKKLRKHHHHGG